MKFVNISFFIDKLQIQMGDKNLSLVLLFKCKSVILIISLDV